MCIVCVQLYDHFSTIFITFRLHCVLATIIYNRPLAAQSLTNVCCYGNVYMYNLDMMYIIHVY